MKLLANADKKRFYLVPETAALGPGSEAVIALTGEISRVDARQIAKFEVPEAVAKGYAEEATARLGQDVVDLQLQLSQTMSRAQADLRRIAAQAGLGGDPQAALKALGVDPAAEPETAIRILLEKTRTLATELPAAIEGTLDADAALGRLDATLGQDDAVARLLATVAQPGTSPELREAAERIAEMQRKLKEE
jgi:hypothetical protein